MKARRIGLLGVLVLTVAASGESLALPYDCPDGMGRCEYVFQAAILCPGLEARLANLRDRAAGAAARCLREFRVGAGRRGRPERRRFMRECQRRILAGVAAELLSLLDEMVLQGCQPPPPAVGAGDDPARRRELERCFARESRGYCEPLRRLRRRMSGIRDTGDLSPGRLRAVIRNLLHALQRALDARCRDLRDELDFCLFCGIPPAAALHAGLRAGARGDGPAAVEAAVCPKPEAPPTAAPTPPSAPGPKSTPTPKGTPWPGPTQPPTTVPTPTVTLTPR